MSPIWFKCARGIDPDELSVVTKMRYERAKYFWSQISIFRLPAAWVLYLYLMEHLYSRAQFFFDALSPILLEQSRFPFF